MATAAAPIGELKIGTHIVGRESTLMLPGDSPDVFISLSKKYSITSEVTMKYVTWADLTDKYRITIKIGSD